MTYAIVEAKALKLVQQRMRAVGRWVPEFFGRDRHGNVHERWARFRNEHGRDAELAAVLDHRAMLGPRWLNPIAWAVALGVISVQSATEAGMLRKMEQGSGK